MQRQNLVLCLLWTLIAGVHAADPGRFLPDANCTTSLCHGGAGESRGQHSIWSRQDMHARSYATLTTARSDQIIKALAGLVKTNVLSAPTNNHCTTCHAPYHGVPAQRFTPIRTRDPDWKPRLSDPFGIKTHPFQPNHKIGVACQNCHGPGEHWALAHTRLKLDLYPPNPKGEKVFTRASCIQLGMRDLRRLHARANACVACHQNVEQNLLRAGHPELIFELDGQTLGMPRHWVEDRDKDYAPAEAWLIGQLVALREMTGKAAKLPQPDPGFTERWSALIWLLKPVAEVDSSFPSLALLKPDPATAAEQIAALNQFAGEVEDNWSQHTEAALKRLATTAPEFAAAGPTPSDAVKTVHARRAERLVLALDRLASSLDPAAAKKLDPHLQELFKQAQSIYFFSPTEFARHLETLHSKL